MHPSISVWGMFACARGGGYCCYCTILRVLLGE